MKQTESKKTKPEKLVRESKEGLSAFLSSGKINKNDLEEKLDFTGLDIDDFDRLKRMHFVLSESVIDFVEHLPEQIRRINTESRRENKTTKGEIKGRIDWNKTLKKRYSQNYKDKSLFITKNPYIEYNIPENLVLKKVLGIIYEVIDQELREVDYDWREEKWGDNLIEGLNQIYSKNVHIDRIKDHQDIRVSGKDLEAARNSRKKIYRDAYDLYTKYQKLMENRFDEDEIEKLLSETLVQPKNDDTLFEIFTVIKVIEGFGTEYELKSIRGGNEFAKLEKGNQEIKIFYDSQGDLKFREDLERNKGPSRFMQKSQEISNEFSEIRKFFLGEEGDYTLSKGTPDIVIEYLQDEELQKVIIGEIKYTDKESTFSKGLKQLIKYLKFARTGEKYIQENHGLKGLIISDKLNFEQPEELKPEIRSLNTEKLLDLDTEAI